MGNSMMVKSLVIGTTLLAAACGDRPGAFKAYQKSPQEIAEMRARTHQGPGSIQSEGVGALTVPQAQGLTGGDETGSTGAVSISQTPQDLDTPKVFAQIVAGDQAKGEGADKSSDGKAAQGERSVEMNKLVEIMSAVSDEAAKYIRAQDLYLFARMGASQPVLRLEARLQIGGHELNLFGDVGLKSENIMSEGKLKSFSLKFKDAMGQEITQKGEGIEAFAACVDNTCETVHVAMVIVGEGGKKAAAITAYQVGQTGQAMAMLSSTLGSSYKSFKDLVTAASASAGSSSGGEQKVEAKKVEAQKAEDKKPSEDKIEVQKTDDKKADDKKADDKKAEDKKSAEKKPVVEEERLIQLSEIVAP